MPDVQDLRRRFQDLDKLDPTPDGSVARTRGNEFEDLLLDLLQAHQLLLRRSYHTADNRSEQIDGAVLIDGRVTLVEAKWTKESVAASELYAFLGKVEGKFTGTIGVFVSRTELSSNFIGALRAGRRQSIIVIHGDDVPALFDDDFDLPSYLRECLYHVSIDNRPHLSVGQFRTRTDETKAGDASSKKAQLKDLLETLNAPGATGLVGALAASKTESQLVEELTDLIRVVPAILLKWPTNAVLRQSAIQYIAAGASHLPQRETDVDRVFLGKTLPATLVQPEYLPVIGAFGARLRHVTASFQDAANSVVVEAWQKADGTFEEENKLVDVTKILWPHLSELSKQKLLAVFLRIINSYVHRPGFPQFELARGILNDPQNRVPLEKVIGAATRDEYTRLVAGESQESGVNSWAWPAVMHSYHNAIQRVRGLEDILVAFKPSDVAG